MPPTISVVDLRICEPGALRELGRTGIAGDPPRQTLRKESGSRKARTPSKGANSLRNHIFGFRMLVLLKRVVNTPEFKAIYPFTFYGLWKYHDTGTLSYMSAIYGFAAWIILCLLIRIFRRWIK